MNLCACLLVGVVFLTQSVVAGAAIQILEF